MYFMKRNNFVTEFTKEYIRFGLAKIDFTKIRFNFALIKELDSFNMELLDFIIVCKQIINLFMF
jgi:hypothetical protein